MAKKTEMNELSALKSAIKAKNLGRFYVFHGEEMFLLRYYLEQMKKILVDDLTESFNYTRLTAETFELQTFVDAVESFPMMADTTMVVVDDVDLFKLAETERNKLAEVFSDIPDYCTVVFTYETVAWKPDKRYKKFWEAIENAWNVVEFAKQDQRDLIAWVQRHFAAAKKQIAPELCAYLIDITGGTMTALAGEISKIVSYSGAEHICKADIDAVVEPVLDAVVFQMTDMLSQGNYGGALLKLQTLLKMQQEPIPILGAIGGALRRIATARILLDNGRPASELQKLCAPMTDYAARKNMEAARRFSPEFCRKAAQLLVETDYKMKTSFDEQERLLEILILQLAKEARRD